MSKTQKSIRAFIAASPTRLVWFMTHMKDAYWQKQREKEMLTTYHHALRTVPAYKTFLTQSGVEHPEKIESFADFVERVPIMDKSSYLMAYPLEDLCEDGSVAGMQTMTTSSGSSGIPYFFLHSREGFASISAAMRGLLEYLWDIEGQEKKVLYINALALGLWMGGVIGDHVLKDLSKDNPRVTNCAPGADAERVIDVIEKLGHHYDMVVIVSYPSMFKSILELGDARNIDWQSYNVKMTSFGELIDNSLHDYFLEKISPNPDTDISRIFDLYGGTEMGNPGIGTPLTTLIKNLCRKNAELSDKILGNHEGHGAIFQANPLNSWVEEVGGDIVITQREKIPIIRYNIKDIGRVITWKEMMQICKECGVDLSHELKNIGWTKQVFEWPFIVFLNRRDWAVSFFGAKVAPQSIQHLFAHDGRIASFKLATQSPGYDLRFVVHLELQPGVPTSEEVIHQLTVEYHKHLLEYLLKTNFDFKDAYSINKAILDPLVLVHDYQTGPFSRIRQGKAKLI